MQYFCSFLGSLRTLLGVLSAFLFVFVGTLVGEVYNIPPSDFASKMTVSGCFCEKEGKILLLLRSPERSLGNTWCLPAATVYLSESPIAAIVRELKKSLGVTCQPADFVLFKKFYVRLPDKDFELYLFETNLAKEVVISLNQKENTDFKWVTLAEALELPLIPGAEVYMKSLGEKKSHKE